MTSQPHSIDHVPGVDRLSLPELLAHVSEDGVDPGVGVVDQQVQPPTLLAVDPLKQLLHVTVHTMVHDHGDGVSSSLLDLLGAVWQVGLSPASDVDRGPGLTQL